jgi:hypothetical protein
MKLSRSFDLEEFLVSQTATRRGIPNIPSEAVVDELTRLCSLILQPLRDRLARPIVISSGYRSPMLNEAIGGAKNSDHMKGRAADIVVPSMAVRDVCGLVIGMGLPFDQLIHEQTWTHVSIAPVGVLPGREQLTAIFTHTGVRYLKGIE